MITHLHVGIDVSKDTLDVSASPDGTCFEFFKAKNDASGFERIHAWLSKLAPEEAWRISLEATSAYHRAVVLWFAQKKTAILVLNPKQARDLARGLGILRKNDPTDAKVLALCSKMAWREPVPLPSPECAQLQELSRRIDALTRERAKERKRLLRPGQAQEFTDSCRRLIEFLGEEIERLQKVWHRLLLNNKEMKATYTAVLSVPGVGAVTARIVVSELFVTERTRNGKQCVAYAGMAPHEQTSGTSLKAQSQTFKTGNKRLRAALYMGAVSSIQHDTQCRELYMRITGKGKPKKVALVAVMAKTLRRIAAVAKRQTLWKKIT